MKIVGLNPSSTGAPGGSETGQAMSHYVSDNGSFAAVCQEFLNGGFQLAYGDAFGEQQKKTGASGLRVKYNCAACGLNAWAKPNVSLICGSCDVSLQPQP